MAKDADAVGAFFVWYFVLYGEGLDTPFYRFTDVSAAATIGDNDAEGQQ